MLTIIMRVLQLKIIRTNPKIISNRGARARCAGPGSAFGGSYTCETKRKDYSKKQTEIPPKLPEWMHYTYLEVLGKDFLRLTIKASFGVGEDSDVFECGLINRSTVRVSERIKDLNLIRLIMAQQSRYKIKQQVKHSNFSTDHCQRVLYSHRHVRIEL